MNWSRTAIAITIALFIAFGPMPSFGANEKPESNTGKTSSTTADELKELREKANAGDSKSQTDLGQKYQYGWGTKQDYTEAVRWYRKAAEQGDADAQFFLGLMYDIGEGVKQNYAEAVKWYRKAAEQGDDSAQYNYWVQSAQFNLGLMYHNGEGVKQNYAEAAKWYRKAAEQGHVDAQESLGMMYYSGEGVQQDYAEAASWLRKAAEKGHAGAQTMLGAMYSNGAGVSRDSVKALKWTRKGAEQGHAFAQFRLGGMYENGWGVRIDNYAAADWYRKAAEQGFAVAQDWLGDMYVEGKGVPKSKFVAIDWWYKAGLSYLKNGDRKHALQLLDNMENLVPGHFLTKKLMKKIYGGETKVEKTEEKQQTYFGTAWPVASGYAVTNNHVVGSNNKITLVLTNGVKIPATIAIRDAVNDIVLLKPLDPKTTLPPALPISSNTPRIGASVFTVGYPLLNLMGTSPKLVSGKINALTGFMDDPRTMQISVPVQSGNSGGPLLNMKGEVVGIVTSKLNAAKVFEWTGDLPQNVNYAVKVNYIKALLDTIPPRKNKINKLPVKAGTLEEIAERVKNSVMIVVAE